ncbi:MAG: tetratricopeptide repeat protein [Bacteroidales bacterium]|jgi:tetratricopeptide (TPR) repeat protein
MRKYNRGAVIRTALFFFLLLPVTFISCRNNDKKAVKKGENTAMATPPDSSSLLVIEKLIRENPKSPDLFAKRAKIYADKNNYTQALSDITIALKMDSLTPAYYISQAEYYIFNAEPNSAKKGLSVCLNKFPENTDAMLKMAEIHLYLKEYGQAKMMLKQVLSINNDLAQIYFIQGLVALETTDSVGALNSFKITIDKDPEYYAAYIQAGKICANQGNELAVQYLKSAIDLQPHMFEAHYLLGLYYQDHGYLDEAQQEYEYISAKIDSTLTEPYYNRGYIEMVYKANFKEAGKWFSKAIYWNPQYVDAWYNRGFSYELDGELSKAKSDYEKAMELQPNFPLAIKGLNRIADGKPIQQK